MSNLKRYLIMIDNNYTQNLAIMAQKLEAKGCKVEQLLEQLGIIDVSTESNQIEELSQMEGVLSVTSGEDEFFVS